jgi:hypothetical protein
MTPAIGQILLELVFETAGTAKLFAQPPYPVADYR